MEPRRWINQSQPQTLVIATFLLYLSAGFTLIFFGERVFYLVALCGTFFCGLRPLAELARFLVPALAVAAGWGIANERGWSWPLALVAGALPLAARLVAAFRLQTSPLSADLIGLLFDGALVALLLHPQSREYQRIWFTGGGQRRRR